MLQIWCQNWLFFAPEQRAWALHAAYSLFPFWLLNWMHCSHKDFFNSIFYVWLFFFSFTINFLASRHTQKFKSDPHWDFSVSFNVWWLSAHYHYIRDMKKAAVMCYISQIWVAHIVRVQLCKPDLLVVLIKSCTTSTTRYHQDAPDTQSHNRSIKDSWESSLKKKNTKLPCLPCFPLSTGSGKSSPEALHF